MPRDLEALAQALHAFLPGGERITGIRQMTWGLSNGTYIVEGLDRVLRMPPDEAGLLPPYDMARQHAIYDVVGRTPGAPPVPRVYELCDDARVAGAPFYLMEWLRGESFDRHNLPSWLADDPASCDALCRAWVDTMASVHALPAGLLPGPTEGPAEQAERWLGIAQDQGAPAEVIELLRRFSVEPPPGTGPLTTVHGDPNLTNLLWDGPRVVALLDWELSGTGEPFSDIAFLLTAFRDEGEPPTWGFNVPGWWTKPQVVRHWEARTGRKAPCWRQHELLAMARLATIMCIGRGLVGEGRKTDPRVIEMTLKLENYTERIRRRTARMHLID